MAREPFNEEAVRLSKELPEERRQEFVGFVMTGEASPGFLQYLETDKTAQTAAETLFARTAEALESVGRALRKNSDKPLFAPAPKK